MGPLTSSPQALTLTPEFKAYLETLPPFNKVHALCKTGKVDGDVSIDLLNIVNEKPQFRSIVDELVKLSTAPAPAPKVSMFSDKK